MDTKELRTLKILEEIDNGQAPSQRDLATRLNISLGLVNSFMKRLTQKGYFKITNIPKNRVKYILTPKGAAEKTRLTYEYIQYSFQFYKDARRKLKDIFKQFEKQQIKRVVFWGTGELAEIAYISMQETRTEPIAVIDEKESGRRFMKHEVLPGEAIKRIEFDRVLITTIDRKGDALSEIMKKGIKRSAIVYI